jgi:hypothetical protein
MPVYVDDLRLPFGRMVMCHMFADTEAELHDMAERIGVARKWFQTEPHASWNHYDIALSKKALAVQYGAILTDRYGAVFHEHRRLALIETDPYWIAYHVDWLARVYRLRQKYSS